MPIKLSKLKNKRKIWKKQLYLVNDTLFQSKERKGCRKYEYLITESDTWMTENKHIDYKDIPFPSQGLKWYFQRRTTN